MLFNATFNDISVIPRRSVLLVEETGESGKNHWPVASQWQTLSHNATSPWSRFKLTAPVVIGTNYISSCKSTYHTITASIQKQGIKIQRYKKSGIMLENIKKILQIQTVEQWHRKKWNVWHKNINFYFSSLLGGFLSGSFCPRGFFSEGRGAFVLDPDSPFLWRFDFCI